MANWNWVGRPVAGMVIVVTAATLAGCLPAPPRDLGVFAGSIAPTNVNAFATWLGRTPGLVNDYLPDQAWADPTPWIAPWTGSPWKMSFGVPMLPPDGTLADGAAGVYDAHYQQLAQKLIARGLDDAILRIGFEFNGSWFRWRAAADPAAFQEFWRRIVLTMRSVPGANFEFDWTVLAGGYEIAAVYAYPGDAYVDYIGVNIFDSSEIPQTYPIPATATPEEAQARRQMIWSWNLNRGYGLSYWAQFAASHRKYVSVPEWGLVNSTHHGGGDNAYFIERMHDWITHTNVAYHAYFNSSGGLGSSRLTGATAFPAAAARYLELFG